MVGEMWGLRFMMTRLSGKCGDFATGELREDWSKLCFRSIEEKIAGKNKNVCVKIHRLFFIFCVCMK